MHVMRCILQSSSEAFGWIFLWGGREKRFIINYNQYFRKRKIKI